MQGTQNTLFFSTSFVALSDILNYLLGGRPVGVSLRKEVGLSRTTLKDILGGAGAIIKKGETLARGQDQEQFTPQAGSVGITICEINV